MRYILSLFTFLLLPSLAFAGSTASYKADMGKMHDAMHMQYSAQPDTDFARGMIPHHQGAVDMARTVLQYGEDDTIAYLANAIIVSQVEEIGIMNRWLNRRGYPEPTSDVPAESTRQFHADMRKMHHAMNIEYTGNADLDFVCGMIPHHQGAIDMAAVEVSEGRKPEMLALAPRIILQQQADIALMRRWLNRTNQHCALQSDMMHHSGEHHG